MSGNPKDEKDAAGTPSHSVTENEKEQETVELDLLLNDIFEQYGVDFREYAYSSLRRRVMRRVIEERVSTISQLHLLVLSDPACMQRLLTALTIHVTAMFRDPGFYRALREQVLPVLRTYPFLRFWVAGCSTGEEVYSLAILLHEAGLYSRSRIYATDLRESVLLKARAGIFPISEMQEYTRNYQKSGGCHSLADYYASDDENVIFRPFLKENVVFAMHNLACDASFNEFHAILCRNVMIYFNKPLQERVHTLFSESLISYGYLGLGRSESVRFHNCECQYEAVSAKERIYRRIK